MSDAGSAVDTQPLNEAIAAVKQRAAATGGAGIEAVHIRLGAAIGTNENLPSRATKIAMHRATLDYACIVGFEDVPRENLWRIVNKIGAMLGEEGLRREPYVRQQLAAALMYIAEGSKSIGFEFERDGYMMIAGVRASIVADPDDFPLLWTKDSGSDWAEFAE
jgi:hypothetical protein